MNRRFSRLRGAGRGAGRAAPGRAGSDQPKCRCVAVAAPGYRGHGLGEHQDHERRARNRVPFPCQDRGGGVRARRRRDGRVPDARDARIRSSAPGRGAVRCVRRGHPARRLHGPSFYARRPGADTARPEGRCLGALDRRDGPDAERTRHDAPQHGRPRPHAPAPRARRRGRRALARRRCRRRADRGRDRLRAGPRHRKAAAFRRVPPPPERARGRGRGGRRGFGGAVRLGRGDDFARDGARHHDGRRSLGHARCRPRPRPGALEPGSARLGPGASAGAERRRDRSAALRAQRRAHRACPVPDGEPPRSRGGRRSFGRGFRRSDAHAATAVPAPPGHCARAREPRGGSPARACDRPRRGRSGGGALACGARRTGEAMGGGARNLPAGEGVDRRLSRRYPGRSADCDGAGRNRDDGYRSRALGGHHCRPARTGAGPRGRDRAPQGPRRRGRGPARRRPRSLPQAHRDGGAPGRSRGHLALGDARARRGRDAAR